MAKKSVKKVVKKATKRAKRKPCSEEAIYTSSSGATIRSSQMINEILCRLKAKFIGIDTGDKPWEHPSLKEFYMNQWQDISTAIRRFGDRVVLEAIQENSWICDCKYSLSHPLRSKKLIEIMSMKASRSNVESNSIVSLPQNHVKEVKRKVRDY